MPQFEPELGVNSGMNWGTDFVDWIANLAAKIITNSTPLSH